MKNEEAEHGRFCIGSPLSARIKGRRKILLDVYFMTSGSPQSGMPDVIQACNQNRGHSRDR